MKRPRRSWLFLTSLLGLVSPAWAEVTVVVPADDAASLVALSRGGQDLVQGVALEGQTAERLRREIQAKGLYGIVTVSRVGELKRLPYAQNLVNHLRIDLDALAGRAPAREEMLRVLTPGGVAEVTEHGQVTRLVKPRPAGLDDWTHFDYDAAGTGVSQDKLVAPANVQWWSEVQEYIGLGGNPAGYRPYTGFRIANGRAFALYGTGKIGEKNALAVLIARDAFNGTPLWTVPAYSAGSGTPQEYQFVVSDDRVFTYLAADGPLVGLDAATGRVATTFDKAGRLPGRESKLAAGYIMFRHAAGKLVQTERNRLIVLNDKTGDVVWTHEEKEDYLCFPRVQERERRVYVQAVESGANKIQGRWANLKTTALLCFDLESGRLLWRSDDLKGTNFGQSIVSGEKVFLFNPGGIGASDVWGKNNGQGNVACLSAADGKLLWTTPQKFVWGYNLLVRDGQPYFASPDTLTAVDPASGRLEPFWRAPYNNRCNRTSATEDWLIMGLGVFVDRAGLANVKSISRSGCAQGAFPANGMTYYTPNTCTCFTMLRGHLALSSETEGAPVADGVRLETGGGGTEAGYAGRATTLDMAVSSEWRVQVNQGATETAAVSSADGTHTYVAVIHEHRLECRDASSGRVAWSFTAGGRISQPPTLDGDQIFFGSHDGYAYCLGAASGRLIWRFMGAPVEREIVSHGQLESAYPIYNVVMFEGRACFTAGLHPEVGAGIHAWGLDPNTGATVWHRVIRRSEVLAKTGAKIAPNRVLNSPLMVDDRTLAITGLNFIPDETDEAIRQRMDTSSLGDKLRNLGWTLRGTPVQKR